MAMKLFDFLEQFMNDTFLIKLTQFEKKLDQFFNSLGNLII